MALAQLQVSDPISTTGLTIVGTTTGIIIPSGVPSNGTTNALYQVSGSLYFNGSVLGGGSVTLTDDNSTNATYYPVIATTAGGSTLKTSSTKISFNPSTGNLVIGGPLTLAASQGITLPSGAPGTTTNALYSVSGTLYFNGTAITGGTGLTNPMTTLGDFIYGGASGAGTRLAGNITARQQMLVQMGTGTVSAAPYWINTPEIIITGMDPTGATDSTSAINTAITALPTNGGTLRIPDPGPTGFYSFNLVLTKTGVTIIGPGMSNSGTNGGGAPVRYCQAYNTTLPVIQIGNDTLSVYTDSCHLRDFCFYGGNNSSQYGLTLTGGCIAACCEDIQIINFSNQGLTIKNEDVTECEYSKFYNLRINSNIAGAVGLAILDKHVSGTGWTSAIDIIGFSIQAVSYQILCDSTQANLTNGYIQSGVSGSSIMIKNSYSGANIQYIGLVCENVNQDAVGTGNYNVGTTVNIPTINSTNLQESSWISGDFSSGGNTFVAPITTTGSITGGLKALTVASATGIYAGKAVMVVGAGPNYLNFVSFVQSISGTTLTLFDAANYTVAGATVYVGDITGFEAHSMFNNSAGYVGFYPLNKAGINTSNAPILYQTACPRLTADQPGQIGPWNQYGNVIFEQGLYNFYLLEQIGTAATPTSITQSGYTVTVTMGSYAAPGDIVVIGGVKERGINGTWVVQTVPGGYQNNFTFTCNFSQTLAGVTGVPLVTIYKSTSFGGSQDADNHPGSINIPSGEKSGIWFSNPTVAGGNLAKTLYQDAGSSNFYLMTPDATNGILNLWAGTAITTGPVLNIGDSGGTVFSVSGLGQVTANGAINKVTITAPTTSATLTLITGSTLATSTAASLTLALSTVATTVTTIPSGTHSLAITDAANTFSGLQTFSNGITVNNTTITAPQSTASLASLTLPLGSASYTGGTLGTIWNDYTRQTLGVNVGASGYPLVNYWSGVIWTKTAATTLSNWTTAATILGAAGTGVGTLTLPANFFVVGKTIRLTLKGYLGTYTSAPTLNIQTTLGGSAVSSSGAVSLTTVSMSIRGWSLEYLFTCRTTGSSGTVIGTGEFIWSNSATLFSCIPVLSSTATTINTTTVQAIDVTMACSSANASNTVVCTVATVEVLN
jgi:hypothetical protein